MRPREVKIKISGERPLVEAVRDAIIEILLINNVSPVFTSEEGAHAFINATGVLE